MNNNSNLQVARVVALRLLSQKFYTEAELMRKLQKITLSQAESDSLFVELRTLNYVDDERLLRELLINYLKYKSYGYYLILQKIKKRGFSAGLIASLLPIICTPKAETEVARRFILRSNSGSRIKLDARKLNLRLKNRGFRPEIIRKFINSFPEDV